MPALTNFAENKIQDAVWRGQPLGAPATWYFALFTSDPTETGVAGVEVTGGAYARVAVVASLTNFAGTQGAGTTTASSGTSGTTSNNTLLTYPDPTANWGAISHIGVLDASTGGNMWAFGPVNGGPIAINNGQQGPVIDPGTWTFQIDT
jgi:hypothetical protein